MIGWDSIMDVISLHKEHKSIRKVSRLSGMSRNTIRRILRDEHAPLNNCRNRQSALAPFFEYINGRYASGLSALLIHQELLKIGYSGSYDPVQRYVKTLRDKDTVSKKMTIRFETGPGHQAQLDWGYCGHSIDKSGKVKPLYVFAYVLSFSRFCYVEFTESMQQEILVNCHKNAFDYCCGVPSQILYDNMKQVRLGPNKLNPIMVDFSQYYGFNIKTCRPYRPRTKGKVERLINYFKGNFLPGKSFSSLADANAQAKEWMSNVANNRLHSTTGEKPCELLAKENLLNHSTIKPFNLIRCVERKVSVEAFVNFEGNKYSTPPEEVSKIVAVEHLGEKIKIYSKDRLIVEHPYTSGKGKTIAKDEHIAQMWKLTMLQKSSKELPKEIHKFEENVKERPLSVYEEALG
jgi:transposase